MIQGKSFYWCTIALLEVVLEVPPSACGIGPQALQVSYIRLRHQYTVDKQRVGLQCMYLNTHTHKKKHFSNEQRQMDAYLSEL